MTSDRGTVSHDLARVGGAEVTVAVREIETPKGERLELEAVESDERIRLDAVALEAVTWQTDASLARSLGDGSPITARSELRTLDPADEAAGTGETLASVTNEFAHVDVRAGAPGEPAGLELFAPKSNHRVWLNPPALVLVCRQSDATFSALIRREVE